jgi:hypothetical protein
MLMGDLNINLLEENTQSVNLKDLMNTFNLKLLNKNCPTRISDTSSTYFCTLIDHIFSNLDCEFDITTEQACFSDHDSVECKFELHLEPPKDKFKFNRIYSEENWTNFSLLSNECWTDVLSAPTVDMMSEIFMLKLIY